jgi:tetratricopeptide (TPR) repeat protein
MVPVAVRRKKMILCVFCFLVVSTVMAAPEWLTVDEQKPTVLFFHSRRCGYSKKFLEEVMKDEAFLRVLDNFAVQTIFTDDEPEKQKELAVSGTPGYLFFRPDGREYWRSGGYAKAMIIRKKFSDILQAGDQVESLNLELQDLSGEEQTEKRRELAELLIQRGERKEALKQVEILKSVAGAGDYGSLLQMQARAHLRTGNVNLARPLLRLALAKAEHEDEFLSTMRIYVNQVLAPEDKDSALAEIEKFIKRKPEWYGLQRMYAHQAADFGIPNDKAFAFATEALLKSAPDARGSAGWALAKLHRKAGTCDGVRRVIADTVMQGVSMGYIKVMAAEYDGCVEDLKKASAECAENKGASCSL